MQTCNKSGIRRGLFTGLCAGALMAVTAAGATAPESAQSQGQWWVTVPEEESPSPFYDSILYQEIGPRLREIEQSSNRVRVEVIGQSDQGRNLFLAIVSAPEAQGRLGRYQALRNLMIKDPEAAQRRIEEFGDFKVPVLINGSIHGDEYPGTDAAIRLIETLAFGNSEIDDAEIQAVLDSTIVLFNVVQNPDGRVLGQRRNGNGFDLNRDFITQSQPEARATVRLLTEWNPMIMLDLHGFVRPMLIEPTTAPHNPNYEYDLYLNWAFGQALAMEAELLARTGLPALIPYRDWDEGWDDWPPIFAPMYAMYHGSYGHTLETPSRGDLGVDAHFWAVWGALKYVAENRKQMVHDQIEIFRRGLLDLDQVLIPDELLSESPFNQFNELTVIEFPAAYVIPRDGPQQQNPHAAARLVDFLIVNDVQVHQASQGFSLGATDYPAGSYVVWMDQPKRGLANTVLWNGWDISFDPGLTMYDISGWDHTKLWGVTRAIAEDGLEARTRAVAKADAVQGAVTGKGGLYAFRPTSNEAVQAANALLAAGTPLHRATAPFTEGAQSFGAGTFIASAGPSVANELASKHGLEVFALGGLPGEAPALARPKLAVFADEGVVFVLRELGFDIDTVSTGDLNAGVLQSGGYDAFVNSSRSWGGLSADGQASAGAFFAAGGDYVGIGRTGIPFAVDAGLIAADYVRGNRRANGVIDLDFTVGDSMAAGYPAASHGFVSGPVWFDSLPAEASVSASVAPGDFFLSGYWPDWPSEGAAGKPIVVHAPSGESQVSLIGLDPTFRAHPRQTFRILANAIYHGQE